MDVLVVGAGLAGLCAADRLSTVGHDVEVLEARQRVGGRVWSRTLEEGTTVELGGEWIDAAQRSVMALANELALDMVETGQDFISRDLIGAAPIGAGEQEALSSMVVERLSRLSTADAETLTIAELLDSLHVESPAMTVLRSRLSGTFGVELSEISALDLVLEFGLAQASSYVRVRGGNDLLARRLADRLEVRLGVTVRSIAIEGSRVAIETESGVRRADRVVVAVPLGMLQNPGFVSDPSPALRLALDRLQMGVATKIVVPVAVEPPMFRRQEADIPGWYWTGRADHGGTRRAVTGFAGTPRGADILAREAAIRVARAVPEIAATGPAHVVHWGRDPLTGGCYSALRPGDRALLPAFTLRWGGVVFAGEHVNGTGTIEGAITSGFEAAERLMATT